MHTFDRLLDWIAGTLWPLRCAACGMLGTVACSSCLHTLAPSLPRPTHQHQGDLGRLLAAFSLDINTSVFIHALKYLGVQSLAGPLTDRACDIVALRQDTARMFGTNPLIVPVPLHASRLRERGYNQAELIARRVAAITAMPMTTATLIRIRPTHQQVKTSGRDERRENMRGAFTVADKTAITGRDIVLVDDVTTTGATLEDCARALTEAGARTVSAFTLAHG